MRRAAKRDANEVTLSAVLHAYGAQVEHIALPVDLLITYRGITAVAEVKNPDGRDQLQPAQTLFLEQWGGLSAILRTEADCLALLARMAELARAMNQTHV